MSADRTNSGSSSCIATSSSSDAATASPAPASSAAAVSSTPLSAPPPHNSADRAAFFAASNAARAARKREKHERAQAALTEAHQSKLADEKLEALEWCRKHLQLSETAQAARSSGACRAQRCIVLLQFSGSHYKGMQLQNRQNKDSTKSIEGALLHGQSADTRVEASPVAAPRLCSLQTLFSFCLTADPALYRSGAIDDSMHSIQEMRWQRTGEWTAKHSLQLDDRLLYFCAPAHLSSSAAVVPRCSSHRCWRARCIQCVLVSPAV